MIKPISTWTQTFYKLGYTLRRVWRDETDCTDNYTPLAIEVLEERQMLSGFGGPGGDDPMGGGTGGSDGGGTGDSAGEFSGGTPSPPSGAGTGGNGAASPASPGGDHSPDRFNGVGDFSNGLQLPDYWQSVANSVFLASFTPANEQEKQQLEMFGEGIDSLVGIVGGLGGAGAMFNGAKQLKNGAAVGKMAAGHKAINAAGDVGANLRTASFSSKSDDLGRSDMGATFFFQDAWKGPFGGATVAHGYKGQAHTGPPKYELSDSWFGRLIGAEKVCYPDANYGVAKNLSAAEHAAVTRHELAHISFFRSYPEITHLAGRGVGTPGKGVASFIIEFHGNMAEHSGNIGKAPFGALLKDTKSIPMFIDGPYATGLGLTGHCIWQYVSK
jgi:hypothetical protein